MPTPVEEVDCFPRWRISKLIGSVRDVWWTVSSDADVEKIGTELQQILLEKCIPFMDKIDSLDEVMAIAEEPFLRSLPAATLRYAILKHLSGAPVGSGRRFLKTYFANPKLIGLA